MTLFSVNAAKINRAATDVAGHGANAVDRIVAAFEGLTPASVDELGSLYTHNAGFKDPFNDVQGIAEIERIFRHMFDTLEAPRFVVTGRVLGEQQCVLVWDFHFRFRKFRQTVNQTIHGASHLKLDDAGRITSHRDYWDAAEELYEKLPLVGGLMRWLKRRAGS